MLYIRSSNALYKFYRRKKESANLSSIADYLTAHGESVKRAGREYVWESPSGKVSINGSEWYSQYEQIGGGAVKFVQKFFGLPYPDAVRSLLGSGAGVTLVGEKKNPQIADQRKESVCSARKVHRYASSLWLSYAQKND